MLEIAVPEELTKACHRLAPADKDVYPHDYVANSIVRERCGNLIGN